MVANWNPFFIYFKSTGFTPSTFPIQPNFSQNQPAAITLNTGSPQTLLPIMYLWASFFAHNVILIFMGRLFDSILDVDWWYHAIMKWSYRAQPCQW